MCICVTGIVKKRRRRKGGRGGGRGGEGGGGGGGEERRGKEKKKEEEVGHGGGAGVKVALHFCVYMSAENLRTCPIIDLGTNQKHQFFFSALTF